MELQVDLKLRILNSSYSSSASYFPEFAAILQLIFGFRSFHRAGQAPTPSVGLPMVQELRASSVQS